MKTVARVERSSRDSGTKGFGKLLAVIGRPQATRATPQEIGARWELVNEKLESAKKVLEHMASLGDLVDQLRGPLAEEFRERHQEHSELCAAQTAVQQLQERLSETEADTLQLSRRLAATEAALAEATQRHEAQETTLNAKTGEFEQVKIDRAESRARASELADLLKDAQLRIKQLEEDCAVLREKGTSADQGRRESEANAARLQQEVLLAQEELAVLKKHLEQAAATAVQLRRTVTELEERIKAEQVRGVDLERATRAAQAEAAQAARAHESQMEASRAEIGALTARLETSQVRTLKLEALNTELSRALNEASGSGQDARAEIAEMKLAFQRMEERLKAADEELAAMRRDVGSIEAARSAAVERADDLARALKSREIALKRAEDRASELGARVVAAQADYAQRRTALEERMTLLAAQMERERVERAITEGSLDSARKDRARLHNALLDAGGRQELAE